MNQKDIERIERFTAWANKRGLHISIMAHRAPIGDLRKSGKYVIEYNVIPASGHNFYTAKPKDERLSNLMYFD